MSDSEENDEDQEEQSGGPATKHKKIGHRRVDSETGAVSYKKIPTTGLMEAMQIGIGHSVGYITPQESRDILMKDFAEVDVVYFPSGGSPTTPAHRCKDFYFKTYAPRAFKRFRNEFGIEADNFLVSLCTGRLKELSNPGASGSLFFLSHDDNFIIKTIQRKEAIFLQKLLPGYYLNLTQNKKTTLPKFYGSYQYESMGKTIRICVMNNILPSTLKYHEKYDLKGSLYKRQASTKERVKSTPTLKDLDFLKEHPGGLILEPIIYEDLKKTLERDMRVLESFRIMDYSILLGIHNLTLAKQETLKSRKPNLETRQHQDEASGYDHNYAKKVLDRIGSKRTKEDWRYDDNMPDTTAAPPAAKNITKRYRKHRNNTATPELIKGFNDGIPAVNERGEECLLFLGIIDILQSYRFLKKVEHGWKSIIADGDTVSVHRPKFYANRFKNFCFERIFKRGDDSSPQFRRHKSGVRRQQSSNHLYGSSSSKNISKNPVGNQNSAVRPGYSNKVSNPDVASSSHGSIKVTSERSLSSLERDVSSRHDTEPKTVSSYKDASEELKITTISITADDVKHSGHTVSQV